VFADNGLGVDMEALGRLLNESDVLTIGFVAFPERLLIDTRSNDAEGPMVAMVGPVQTVQERYMWLGKHRSAFGPPEGFAFFVWPRSVRALIEHDIMAPMRDRLDRVSPGSGEALDELLREFFALEVDAWRGAIRGDDRWATVWSREAEPA
jgi:hypothetical protein